MKPEELRKVINKELGDDVIKMGNDPTLEVEYLPTGVLPLDYLLGGGLPMGRATEIYGDFSSLKSYVGLCAASIAQENDLTAAIVDTEHAFDPSWASSLGVDVDKLILMQPTTGEDAVDATVAMVRSGVGLVVWDSVAATMTRTESEKSARDVVQPARLAAFMSQALRRINTHNSKTAMLWINQTRLNVGVSFGNPTTTPGGKSLPFYASMRVAMFKSTKLKDGDLITGQTIRAQLEKSKLSRPHRQVKFDYIFGEGPDDHGFLFDLGVAEGIITQPKKGTYVYGDIQARGKGGFRKKMDDTMVANLWEEIQQ